MSIVSTNTITETKGDCPIGRPRYLPTARLIDCATPRSQDPLAARHPDRKTPIWYALYTKPRFEKKVAAVLSEAGYTAYLPLTTTIRQWSDRKKKVQVPLINSYVFVQIDATRLNDLLKYQGVVRVLKYLGKPAKVQEKEIESLKIICDNSGAILATKNLIFSPGTPIQITAGPMIGLYGECVTIKGKNRLIVSVKNLGLEFVLDLPLTYIEPVNSRP